MNKLWSYCGLVEEKIRFSDKDIPVLVTQKILNQHFTKLIHNIYLAIQAIILSKNLKIYLIFYIFRSFFNSKFKTQKRADTPTDFHDVDDSDDEKPFGANTGGSGGAPNNRNVRLFSTPQHNPNNPFNATPERTVPVAKPVHYK